MYCFLQKNCWATLWAIFFTNSSGHPDWRQQQSSANHHSLNFAKLAVYNPNIEIFCKKTQNFFGENRYEKLAELYPKEGN
jgi:hypothetical protein